MKLGINKTFGYGTILEDYRAVNKIFKLKEGLRKPYLITAGACVDQVNNWMKRKYPKHQIMHILEEGDCGQGDLRKLARTHKVPIIPLAKRNPATGVPWVQFQAADLVAGAWRNAAGKRGKVQAFEDYGDVFNEIVRMLPQRSLVYHADNLRAACEAEPEKFQSDDRNLSAFLSPALDGSKHQE